jgi:glycerol uptake facilitator-like aquaporin
MYSNTQKILLEFFGTAALLCTVVGSGIMGNNLANGNAAVALLGNTLATVAMLYLLIELIAPVSGAHFNPLVTILMGKQTPVVKMGFILAQCSGAFVGVWLAHLMFELPVLQVSTKVRMGVGQWIAEALATMGLLLVIYRTRFNKAAVHVSAFIGAAYWFTASTSFANPVAVLGRMYSNTFAGIAPESAMFFLLAQCVGALLAYCFNRVFLSTH